MLDLIAAKSYDCGATERHSLRGHRMTGFLTVLQAVGAFIGVWTLASVATAIVVIPWFRARARANDALARSDRATAWESVALAGDDRKVAAR
jgi:hypothetical protein